MHPFGLCTGRDSLFRDMCGLKSEPTSARGMSFPVPTLNHTRIRDASVAPWPSQRLSLIHI
eukprot:5741742-Alexandrium_andersonii.AAC.1